MNTEQTVLFASKPPLESMKKETLPDTPLPEAIMLAQSTLLARKGKYSQADAVLSHLVRGSDARLEALDLFAKVCAQQGKIEQAQAAWLKALEREPSNLHFLYALELCAHYQNSGFRKFVCRRSRIFHSIFLLILVSAVVAVVIGCIL